MKKIMKVVSLILTFALMVGMAIPSFAEVTQDQVTPKENTSTNTITLNGPTGYDMSDKTFSAYRILCLEAKDGADTYSLPFEGADADGLTSAPKETGNYRVRQDLISAINAAHDSYGAGGSSSFHDLDTTATLFTILDHLRGEGEEGGGISNNAAMEDFAKAMLTNIKNNQDLYNLLKLKAPTYSAGAEGDNTKSTYTFSNVPLGYYLIVDETEAGNVPISALILVNNDSANENITLKASQPTLDKSVVNGENTNGTSASVGDIITFKLETKIPNALGYVNTSKADTYQFYITDTLSKGLALLGSGNSDLATSADFDVTDLTITIGGEPASFTGDTDTDLISAEIIKLGSESTIVVNGSTETKFKIDMAKLARAVATGDSTYKVGDPIVITYKAKLTQAAATDLKSSKNNKAELTYSNDPNGTTTADDTPEDTNYVYTFGLEISKRADDNNTKLQGAQFIIKKQGSGSAEYLTATDGESDAGKGGGIWIANGWTGTKNSATHFITDASGKVNINGLAAGKYTLIEVQSPATYYDINGNADADEGVDFTIAATYVTDGDGGTLGQLNTLTYSVDKTYNGVPGSDTAAGRVFSNTSTKTDLYAVLPIINSKRAPLPETGGMGTTMIYVVGGALIVIAGVLLISKRRMHAAR